jgi:hypothetical protein
MRLGRATSFGWLFPAKLMSVDACVAEAANSRDIKENEMILTADLSIALLSKSRHQAASGSQPSVRVP